MGCPPVGLGLRGSKKLREVGSLFGYLTARGKSLSLCESGTVGPLLANAAVAPGGPSHAGAQGQELNTGPGGVGRGVSGILGPAEPPPPRLTNR